MLGMSGVHLASENDRLQIVESCKVPRTLFRKNVRAGRHTVATQNDRKRPAVVGDPGGPGSFPFGGDFVDDLLGHRDAAGEFRERFPKAKCAADYRDLIFLKIPVGPFRVAQEDAFPIWIRCFDVRERILIQVLVRLIGEHLRAKEAVHPCAERRIRNRVLLAQALKFPVPRQVRRD